MKHKFLPMLLLILFTVICISAPVAVGSYFSFPETVPEIPYTLQEGEIIIPEILDLSEEEAITLLTQSGLRLVEKELLHHPEKLAGTILTQNPSSGAIAHYGDSVSVTVSDGWEEFVPDVRNLPRTQAIEKLTQTGFQVKTISQADFSAPDSVIAQNPEPDKKISLNQEITLTISKGRDDIDPNISETIENYIGMNFEEVKTILSEKHLYARQIDTVYRPDIANGTVVSQSIPSGNTAKQGTCIDLKISIGQVIVHVPDCSGKHIDEARELLTQAGLTCMTIYTPTSETPLDFVISQNQPPDTPLPEHSQVWLTVSTGSSSYVISTGGWSGNPLPSFGKDSEPPTEEITEPAETAPEIFAIPEPIEPDFPEIPEPEPAAPEFPETDPIIETSPPETETETETTEQNLSYEEAPATAPV